MLTSRAFLALLALNCVCVAQLVVESDPSRSSIRRFPPVMVSELNAQVHQDGVVAKVALTLTLRNVAPTEQAYEVLLPLGSEAVASAFDLKVDGKALEGQVLTAAKAREIYRQLTQRLRDPGLLEHYGDAIFRASIFPVPANGTLSVTLGYVMTVEAENDLSRIRVPLTAFRNNGVPVLKARVSGSVSSDNPITSLYSPTTGISTVGSASHGARHRATFEWKQENFRADSDFILYSRARSESALCETVILSERPNLKEDGYFLAALQGVPQKAGESEPKDVVFVLDKSGSMQGDKIVQAKKAMQFMVERLRAQDRFDLVVYSNTVQVYGGGLKAATKEQIQAALVFIEGISAEGGTNIEGALKEGMALFNDKARVNQLVFLTDGLPTVGERDRHVLCKQALAANQHKVRVVAFGVGFDVNGVLLDNLAVQNRGLSEYVLPNENLEDKIPGFYQRMQNPLVTDAVVSFEGAHVHDTYPRFVGDLYEGERMLLVGRYRAGAGADAEHLVSDSGVVAGPARLIVSGMRHGQPVRLSFNMNLASGARTGDQETVARIWAAKKVGFLVDEVRLNGENKELVDAIVKLGTRFGILTEYTSFLAAEATDLLALSLNGLRAAEELKDRGRLEAGSAGVAQAVNSKGLQREGSVRSENCWLDHDGNSVTIEGVQCVNGKALFARGGKWQDAGVPKDAKVEDVELFSEAFFGLMDRNAWLNRVVARTGEVTCNVENRWVRFTAPKAAN
ncbi:MAG: VWA domain-containing protein [Planctomycetes bacterium]|nr:VWA domain-containing protein [Planctomycetota bacterium]